MPPKYMTIFNPEAKVNYQDRIHQTLIKMKNQIKKDKLDIRHQ